jgi:hypothetical protein
MGAQPTLTMDMVVPTIEITDNTAGTATGDVTYTLTLSEGSTTFAESDITVAGGTRAVSFATGDSGDKVYTLVVTPDANSTTSMTVDVTGGAFTDVAGNNNTAPTQSVQLVNTPSALAVSSTASVAADASGTITATLASAFGTAGTFGLYTLADGVTLYTETTLPASGSIDIIDTASITKNVHAAVFSTAFAIVKNSSNVIVGDAQSVIFGSTAAETLTGTANSDVIFGFAGADTINAGNGNDLIIAGDAGVKTVNAGGGDDTIKGSAAVDTITGGDGIDTMSGYAGADVFNQIGATDVDTTLGTVTDIITDFKATGADTIRGAWGTGASGGFTKAGAAVADLATLLEAASTALDNTTKYYIGKVDGGATYLVTDDDGVGYTEVIQLTGVLLATVVVADIVA